MAISPREVSGEHRDNGIGTLTRRTEEQIESLIDAALKKCEGAPAVEVRLEEITNGVRAKYHMVFSVDMERALLGGNEALPPGTKTRLEQRYRDKGWKYVSITPSRDGLKSTKIHVSLTDVKTKNEKQDDAPTEGATLLHIRNAVLPFRGPDSGPKAS